MGFGYPGIHGYHVPYFDGTAGYINIFSTAFANAFNGAEGTILIWPKVYDAGVWTDAVTRWIIHFSVDGNNTIRIYKDASNPLTWLYNAGGTALSVTLAVTPTNFMRLGLTWSKSNNKVRAFYNGVQTSVDKTGLGVWAGALDATKTVIGAYNTTPVSVWYGYLADGVLLNREATPEEIKEASF